MNSEHRAPNPVELLNLVYSAAQQAKLSAQEHQGVHAAAKSLASLLQPAPKPTPAPEIPGIPEAKDQAGEAPSPEEII